MSLPILDVALCKFFRPEHEKVLGVLLLRCLRKVEAAGDYHCFVNDHHFVVRDRVGRVDVGRYARVRREVGGTVSLLPLRSVENDLNMDTALMRVNKGLGDGRGCE